MMMKRRLTMTAAAAADDDDDDDDDDDSSWSSIARENIFISPPGPSSTWIWTLDIRKEDPKIIVFKYIMYVNGT